MSEKQFAPATQRNRDPILKVLQQVLPETGTILEIASGTGEHAVYFAPQLRPRQWQPSEANPILEESIRAWEEEFPCDTLLSPLTLDVMQKDWIQELSGLSFSALVAINLIHIAPWEACMGLLKGAEQVLPTNGILYLYGPFKRGGQHTAESNAAFDQSLQQQNPQWGVRNLEEVISLAQKHQFELQKVVAMPANNLSVIFRHL
jgi:cyclopropane fatty-acyl-phospholipid synthase-like methyltransferase